MKDSHILDIKKKTIKAGNDLTNEDYFKSHSVTVFGNNLYAVGKFTSKVYEFLMKDNKWK